MHLVLPWFPLFLVVRRGFTKINSALGFRYFRVNPRGENLKNNVSEAPNFLWRDSQKIHNTVQKVDFREIFEISKFCHYQDPVSGNLNFKSCGILFLRPYNKKSHRGGPLRSTLDPRKTSEHGFVSDLYRRGTSYSGDLVCKKIYF